MYLYVIALDPEVLNSSRFRKRNPDYVEGKPCSYVGTSFHAPDMRYGQHKEGVRANKYARKFGLYLQRRHCDDLGEISREQTEEIEAKKAMELRSKGWAVWQG